MRSRLALVPALAVAAVVALAGCSAPAPDPGAVDLDPSATEDPSGPDATGGGCLIGTWELDGQRNAEQLQESFAANGASITSTTADGSVTLTIDDGTMTYDSDITYTMSGDLGGLALTVEQNQAGSSTGNWSEADGLVTFSDWETGIVVNNVVTVGGTATELPIDLPQDVGGGTQMAVTCSGDSLETKAVESPFTGYWSRVG
ncbi:hypothetical protein [Schumannella luteola]